MSNLTYVFAVLLLIGWALGYFVFHLSSSVHVVLAYSLLLFLLRAINGKRIPQE